MDVKKILVLEVLQVHKEIPAIQELLKKDNKKIISIINSDVLVHKVFLFMESSTKSL